MGRKVLSSSNFELRKCDKNAEVSTRVLPGKKKTKEHYALEDRMSPLPDELIVCILSWLTMKEAARTSVLARRWRYLWTFFMGSLDFDCSRRVIDMRRVIQQPKSILQIERLNFVGWVNLVLKSHRGQVIDELKVCFDVDSENFKCDIDSWVKFAIEKRVSQFQLDLTSSEGYKLSGHYSFPSHLLKCSSFRSLTALCLIYVDMSGDGIEYLLSNCSILKVLRIVDSTHLVSLKVCGHQSPTLKYLEIRRCHNLVNLEISAVNLVSFKYSGPNIAIHFNNVPRLVEVSFGGRYNDFIIQNLSQLLSYIPQLERVTLATIFTSKLLGFQLPDHIPEFKNLKHLELGISLLHVHSFLPCTYILKASPFLSEITLKIDFVDSSFDVLKLVNNHPHQCLKVVKLVGFYGVIPEVQVVRYFVKNAVSLEKIIIEPFMPDVHDHLPESVKFLEIERQKVARARAKGLGAKLPPNIEFVVV